MNRHKQLSESDRALIAGVLAKVEAGEDFGSDENWPTALFLINSSGYSFVTFGKDDFSLTDELPPETTTYLNVKEEVEKLKAQGVDPKPDLDYVGIFTGLNGRAGVSYFKAGSVA